MCLQVHGGAPSRNQAELESGAQGGIRHPGHMKAHAGHIGDSDPSDGDGS